LKLLYLLDNFAFKDNSAPKFPTTVASCTEHVLAGHLVATSCSSCCPTQLKDISAATPAQQSVQSLFGLVLDSWSPDSVRCNELATVNLHTTSQLCHARQANCERDDQGETNRVHLVLFGMQNRTSGP
jgi:hypothetical protein